MRQHLGHFFGRQLHQPGHFPFDLHAQSALGNGSQQWLGLVQATGAPLGLVHVVARGQLIQQEARQRRRLAQAGAEGFGTQFAHVRVRIVLGRQEQEADGDIVAQHRQARLQRTPRGATARAVAIETEDDLVAGAQQLLDVVRRGGSAQGRDSIGDTLLRQSDYVHVAFDHDDLAFLANRLAGLP